MDTSVDNQVMDFPRSSVSPENSIALESSALYEEKCLNTTGTARKRFLAFTKAKRKPTIKKIEEAILAIDSASKDGASLIAITEWILCNYEIINPSQLKMHVKRAIIKGLEQGTLLRAKSSKNAPGIIGRFILPQKQSKLRRNASKTKPKKTVNESD